MKNAGVYQLRSMAKAALFVSSYLPLFTLLVLRQLSENYKFLHWGGFSGRSFVLFLYKFGLSTVLIILAGSLGIIGLRILLNNMKRNVKNGSSVVLTEMENKNSEAVAYIGTYIIPFLFQKYGDFYELVAIIFLLFIIYRVYINSNLLLINPILSLRYGLYQIRYDDRSGVLKSGMVILKNKCLEESDTIKIYPIGHKLFFGEYKKEEEE
jgi:hypothetical protein